MFWFLVEGCGFLFIGQKVAAWQRIITAAESSKVEQQFVAWFWEQFVENCEHSLTLDNELNKTFPTFAMFSFGWKGRSLTANYYSSSPFHQQVTKWSVDLLPLFWNNLWSSGRIVTSHWGLILKEHSLVGFYLKIKRAINMWVRLGIIPYFLHHSNVFCS